LASLAVSRQHLCTL